MDMKEYSKFVCDIIETMSDEEFNLLLNESGLDNCPPEDLQTIEISKELLNCNKTYYGKQKLYNTNITNNNFIILDKVA